MINPGQLLCQVFLFHVTVYFSLFATCSWLLPLSIAPLPFCYECGRSSLRSSIQLIYCPDSTLTLTRITLTLACSLSLGNVSKHLLRYGILAFLMHIVVSFWHIMIAILILKWYPAYKVQPSLAWLQCCISLAWIQAFRPSGVMTVRA